jgi:hypothetical protein
MTEDMLQESGIEHTSCVDLLGSRQLIIDVDQEKNLSCVAVYRRLNVIVISPFSCRVEEVLRYIPQAIAL